MDDLSSIDSACRTAENRSREQRRVQDKHAVPSLATATHLLDRRLGNDSRAERVKALTLLLVKCAAEEAGVSGGINLGDRRA